MPQNGPSRGVSSRQTSRKSSERASGHAPAARASRISSRSSWARVHAMVPATNGAALRTTCSSTRAASGSTVRAGPAGAFRRASSKLSWATLRTAPVLPWGSDIAGLLPARPRHFSGPVAPSPGIVLPMRLVAAVVCLALCGCDSVHALFAPRTRIVTAAPEIAMGPWLLDPAAGQITVAWTTAEPVKGRVWYLEDRLAQED